MPPLKRKTTRIGIVDDHELFRTAIVQLIRSLDELNNGSPQKTEVTIEAENGKDFISKLEESLYPVDLVILDINMPEMDGISTLKWIKQNTTAKVIMMTMHTDPAKVALCIKEGAESYLAKNEPSSEIGKAIRSVMTKGYYYNDFITRSLIEVLKHSKYPEQTLTQATLATKILSPREKEVLKWLSTDLTYREIAEQMKLSTRTVEGYRDELFRKLDTKSRTGIVVNALKYGVLEFQDL